MAAKILVPLKRHDRIEAIIPYIAQVTQPGMRVVFLIHHPVPLPALQLSPERRGRSRLQSRFISSP